MADSASCGRAIVGMYVHEALDNCIVSLSEWWRLHELMRQFPDWARISNRLLFATAVIDCAAGGGGGGPQGAQPASNIPLILGRGRAAWVQLLVIHSAEAPHGQSSESLYQGLERTVYLFTRPHHRPVHSPIVGAAMSVLVGRLVEAARVAMPNVTGIVVTRARLLGGVHPQTSSRHVIYCVAAGGEQRAHQPPIVVHGHSRYIVPMQRELPSCVRRHVHFCSNWRFTDIAGNVRAFDWCQVIMSETLDMRRAMQ
ncbi:hypothetical protein IWQ56_001866 [Coemansia nantahalensis]|nr:hypothetical protein IWQ56_001866 [Coemansia nantahalensis]